MAWPDFKNTSDAELRSMVDRGRALDSYNNSLENEIDSLAEDVGALATYLAEQARSKP